MEFHPKSLDSYIEREQRDFFVVCGKISLSQFWWIDVSKCQSKEGLLKMSKGNLTRKNLHDIRIIYRILWSGFQWRKSSMDLLRCILASLRRSKIQSNSISTYKVDSRSKLSRCQDLRLRSRFRKHLFLLWFETQQRYSTKANCFRCLFLSTDSLRKICACA